MPGRGRVPNVPKTAVVGSRTYPNLSLVRHYTRALVARGHVIVTGGAIGVDVTAEQAASSIGGRVIVHEPDWSKRAHETDRARSLPATLSSCRTPIKWWRFGTARAAAPWT